jgi:hypothetical protein
MYLPRQSEPVQRTLPGRPFVNQGNGSASDLSAYTNEQGMRASEYGVQPSGFDWESIVNYFRPIATNFTHL